MRRCIKKKKEGKGANIKKLAGFTEQIKQADYKVLLY